MLLKKLSKARTGGLISERAESIGRIEVCRFIIRSSKLPFFLTKPFMQRTPIRDKQFFFFLKKVSIEA